MDKQTLLDYVPEEIEKAKQSLLKKREYMHTYHERNRETMNERSRQYYEEHKEEMDTRSHQYYATNRDTILEQHCNYHLKNRAEILDYHSQHYREHPEVSVAAHQNRRVQELSAEGSFTPKEFLDKCKMLGNRCMYCRRDDMPLGPDHAIPLSRRGSNNIDNIVPSCKSCNTRKNTKTPDEYARAKRRATS